VVGAAAAILALVMAIQWGGSWISTHLPPLSRALEDEPGATRAAAAGVMAWASTRSVIGLIAALSIPVSLPDGQPTPGRDLILVIAALVILGSVLVQGLTLRAAVQGAGLARPEAAKEEESQAREAATVAREAAIGDGHEAERRTLAELRERDEIGDEALRKLLRESDLRERVKEAESGGAGTGGGPPQP
jgi:NhaP-type Na+/H+ or K+/H+ antiporter